MIATLPDRDALRFLSVIAGVHRQGAPPEAPPAADLVAALASTFGPPAAGPPPTEADLARAALAVVAEDPATGGRLEDMIEQGPPPVMGVGAALGALAGAMAILQTHVRIERAPSGQWSFSAEKKPASDALVALVHTVSRALGAAPREVDVLILTAIPLEHDAVLAVHAGADPGSAWVTRPGLTGLDVAFRTFLTTAGRPLRVAVTRPLGMGMMAAANAVAPLVTGYRPLCLAMCGVCAGRRGDVHLGDVIVADTLWTYDTGARVVETDAQGHSVERFKAEPLTYNLGAVWKHRAESFRPAGLEAWVGDRPRSYEDQTDWLLARLRAGEEPGPHPDRKVRCADFSTLVPALRKRGLLAPAGLTLTEAGRAAIDDRLLLHPDGLPEREAFAVRVGPIGTGTNLVRDPQMFDRLSERQRKVLGLEMEAAAIGAVAHLHGVEHAIVMKGVMDHADQDKSDHFKAFAARASAECLIAFLRENLAP